MQRTANETAVAPVVGVMLMLVVTIIIAAIVSAFAGSTAQTNTKAPQATIQGTLNVNGSPGQSGGPTNLVKMNHMGGDELVTAKIQVLIRRGDDFGAYEGVLNGNTVISKSLIHNTGGSFWFNATDGGMDVMVWRSGETMFIDIPATSGFTASDLGKSVVLEVDTADGKLISRTYMAIIS